MVMLLDLADVCRGAGLKVVEVPGWRTRSTHKTGMGKVRGVGWHHTGGASKVRAARRRPHYNDYPSWDVLIKGNSTTRGPLCQLGLGFSGTVYVFAAGRCSHMGRGSYAGLSGNIDMIGVEMESPGTSFSHWTPEQLAAMPVLRDALSRAYDVPLSRHIAHREWAPGRKSDPIGINIRSMGAPAATPTGRILRTGMKGNDVLELSMRLHLLGLSPDVTDTYSDRLHAAAQGWQRQAGVGVGGVGPITQKQLREYALPLTPTTPAGVGDGSGRVPLGTALLPGQFVENGPTRLSMQRDGNAVVYFEDEPLWATNTRGTRLVLQNDSNLVLYLDAGGRTLAMWDAGTVGQDASYLGVQGTDGNVVLRGSGGDALWFTGAAAS